MHGGRREPRSGGQLALDLPPPSEAPRPFLKWAGGKRQLLPALFQHLPPRFGAYHEPFLGGGALFFALRHAPAVLGDTNERLVRAYRGVRDDAERVIELLRSYRVDRDTFLRMRELPVDAADDAGAAAWLIYLNRTAFNGLYRVNRHNRFNVPYGDYKNPTLCDADNLRACARALRGVELRCEGFEAVAARARRDDLVYFDPPYVPLSATSSFTGYTSSRFSAEDQRRLRDVALELKRRGVHVLLSNSSAPEVIELYQGAFEIREVEARRSVNAVGSGRGAIKELLMR